MGSSGKSFSVFKKKHKEEPFSFIHLMDISVMNTMPGWPQPSCDHGNRSTRAGRWTEPGSLISLELPPLELLIMRGNKSLIV